jgi:hypothetical protein
MVTWSVNNIFELVTIYTIKVCPVISISYAWNCRPAEPKFFFFLKEPAMPKKKKEYDKGTSSWANLLPLP